MICALILAAGPAKRMGESKQLLPLAGKPLLQHVVDLACSLPFAKVFVILGAYEEEIRRQIDFGPAEPVHNPWYREGMASSLRIGFSLLPERCEAAAIMLGDQPLVRRETVMRLLQEFELHRPLFVVPRYRGQRGNPCIASTLIRAEAMSLRGDVGLRALFSRHEPSIRFVDVDDPGILLDIDTRRDYMEARRLMEGGVSPVA